MGAIVRDAWLTSDQFRARLRAIPVSGQGHFEQRLTGVLHDLLVAKANHLAGGQLHVSPVDLLP